MTYSDERGTFIWRYVGGRRIKIYTGQSLPDAMRESGKFPSTKKRLQTEADNGIISAGVKAINNPIELSHPVDVAFGAKELNLKQQELLDKLPGYGSKVIVSKRDVSMLDLAALTAKTGDEFAMFTRKGERLIIRGDKSQVPLYKSGALELNAKGYKWSGHTHPGFDAKSLVVSDGDRKILGYFTQSSSVLYNAAGKHVVFERE